MKKKILVGIISLSMVFTSATLCFATNDSDGKSNLTKNEDYRIDSINKLKREIKKSKNDNGVLSKDAELSIIDHTKPEVYSEFIQEKETEMNDALNDINIDKLMNEDENGDLSGKIEIDVGDGCKVIAEFKDYEEKNLLSKIRDTFVDSAYAVTNGSSEWKGYGNRYFTASKTMMLGAGYSVIKMENHYKLSSSGITERYGYSSAGGVSANGGAVSAQNPYITDATATTPGKLDVNMSCNYTWSEYAVSGVVTASGTWRMDTVVGYVAKDATNKKIKVKHSWSVY